MHFSSMYEALKGREKIHNKDKLVGFLHSMKGVDIEDLKQIVKFDKFEDHLDDPEDEIPLTHGRKNFNREKFKRKATRRKGTIMKNQLKWKKLAYAARLISKNEEAKNEMILKLDKLNRKNVENPCAKSFIKQTSKLWMLWRLYYGFIFIFLTCIFNFYFYSFVYVKKSSDDVINEEIFYFCNILADISMFLDLIFKTIKVILLNRGFVWFFLIEFPYLFITAFPWYAIHHKFFFIKLIRMLSIWSFLNREINEFIYYILTFVIKRNYKQYIAKISTSITLCFIILISAHVCGCLYHYFFIVYEETEESNHNSLASSIYYIIQSFATVGYGDMKNTDKIQIVSFFFIMQFFGVLIYAFWVGVMRKSITNLEKDLIKERHEDIDNWMIRLERSAKGHRFNNLIEIREYLHSFWTENLSIVMGDNIFKTMTPNLKREIIFVICDNLNSKFKTLFSNTEKGFIEDVVMLSCIKYYRKGKYLATKNKKLKYFYLILEGEISVTRIFHSLTLTLCNFSGGSFYGEFNLLNDSNSAFDVKTTQKSEMLILSKNNFLSILSKYDKARDKLRFISFHRLVYFDRLWDLIKSRVKESMEKIIAKVENFEENSAHILMEEEQNYFKLLKILVDNKEIKLNNEIDNMRLELHRDHNSDIEQSCFNDGSKDFILIKKVELTQNISNKNNLENKTIPNEFAEFLSANKKDFSIVKTELKENKTKKKVNKLENSIYDFKLVLNEKIKIVDNKLYFINKFITYRLYHENQFDRKTEITKTNTESELRKSCRTFQFLFANRSEINTEGEDVFDNELDSVYSELLPERYIHK